MKHDWKPPPKLLEAMRVIIIGAGPGGAMTGLRFADAGANVILIEKRSDPRVVHADDDRSFAITLAEREAQRDTYLRPILDDIGVRVTGRQIHSGKDKSISLRYGHGERDAFRAVTRQGLLACTLDRVNEHPRIKVCFNVAIEDVDADRVVATGRDCCTGRAVEFKGDLIVDFSGARSEIRRKQTNCPGYNVAQEDMPEAYLSLRITREAAERGGLRNDSLQFFYGPDETVIGLPHSDGVVDCLFVTSVERIETLKAMTKVEIVDDLRKRLPKFSSLCEDLAQQVRNAKIGRFLRIRSSCWRYGPRVVGAGDSVHAIPPWFGAGAVAAINDGRVLVECLEQHGDDIDAALTAYERLRRPDADAMSTLIDEQGRLLKKGMRKAYTRLRHRFALLAERGLGRRTLYQRLSFDLVKPSVLLDELQRSQVRRRAVAASFLCFAALVVALGVMGVLPG